MWSETLPSLWYILSDESRLMGSETLPSVYYILSYESSGYILSHESSKVGNASFYLLLSTNLVYPFTASFCLLHTFDKSSILFYSTSSFYLLHTFRIPFLVYPFTLRPFNLRFLPVTYFPTISTCYILSDEGIPLYSTSNAVTFLLYE